MSWARLDDGFHSHPKTLEAWEADPVSIGLFARCLSYVANHERDGKVPSQLVRMWLPVQRDRDRATRTLTDTGLWHEQDGGFVIHDYLDYNPSRDEMAEKRRKDRERKTAPRG